MELEYKRHFIRLTLRQIPDCGRWAYFAVVCWNHGREEHMKIITGEEYEQFTTEAQAEREALAIAKTWVDNRIQNSSATE